MLKTFVSDSQEHAPLCGAILLYAGESRDSTERTAGFATVHKVETIGGRPEIMAGRLMMEEDLAIIGGSIAAAKSAITTTWIDQSLLARASDRLIWWTPPGKRSMFFKKSDLLKGTFEKKGVCPVPGLVWMAMPGNGLFVYAVKGKNRPTQKTALYQAPFFNVWGRGKLCIGNAELPVGEEAHVPAAWEKVLFGSYFTHPNFTQPNRLVKGKVPVEFWKAMLAKPPVSFPETALVSLPLTVSDLLERTVLDKLSKLPVPRGEF